ncbi:probable L-type lectin-domain containing receptor kinase S.5 [Malania oleifera]|uniref:probable L-type lectin-domain containing receptor kinase S.5 n=1 Tax=Malania oleifera TaxID=397392 RepID=UPI0025ADF065|nr:probable L-type lectin-domain containing receptor kinase S.5 [Malania oleifera]
MFCVNNSQCFDHAAKLLLMATLLHGAFIQANCLNFSYPTFQKEEDTKDFTFTEHSYIVKNAIQVTPDITGDDISELSGRVWYKRPFKLWSRQRGIAASFNSTFVVNITPKTDPGGEGLAFILTGDTTIPDKSEGQWLGIVNGSTNGSSVSNIVAVEFDTRKSYPEDVDDNHVGLNLNSIYSFRQVPLGSHGVNLSSGADVTVSVQYNGKSNIMTVFVFMTNGTGENMTNPIISEPFELPKHLPEMVFVGFSASTGEQTELNCVRSWNFTSTEVGEDSSNLTWVWIVLPIILVILLGSLAYCFFRKRKYKVMQEQTEDPMIDLEIQNSAMAPRKFHLKELKSATGNFNSKNELGRGGFGIVFKGFLNNMDVAVKRFSKHSQQGKQDFLAEVKTIGNLHHKNLVKLVGWCHESNELLLVYEFKPNGSLEKFIFRNKNPCTEDPTLSWKIRHHIICGVARALDYLHNGCTKRVLHRDIKASNIMLDSEFNACLGDFGLARTIQHHENTHHSTKEIAGTPGYMAPESFHIGRATAETDVYAFGVLLLEVVCGRKPGNQNEQNNFSNSIVDWVWEYYRRERITDVVDFQLNEDFEQAQAECLLMLGLACSHPNPHQRPSMRTALQVLTGEAAPPLVPIEKPAFMWPPSTPSFNYILDNSFSGGQKISVVGGR